MHLAHAAAAVTDELEQLLRGHIPDRARLDGPLSPFITPGYIPIPEPQQRMHCVVMCVPAPSATDAACMGRLREMTQRATTAGECKCLSPRAAVNGVIHSSEQLEV
jgi:hypothetical protein